MQIASRTDWIETGRNLGHDLYRYGRRIDTADPPVEEGFVHARARGVEQAVPDRFVRKWLQLRISAYRRSRFFDEGVTPTFLELIDVGECPIVRRGLTYGRCAATDWSIDRLNNDGAYARSNLAVMSSSANQAKGCKSFDEVLRLSRANTDTEGLTPTQWLRMAALMLGPSFASNPREAPLVPLVAPIPCYTVRQACQIVQNLFTQQARLQSGKNALIKLLRRPCGDQRPQVLLERFAEAIHRGLKAAAPCWDVWLQPEVMKAFSDWRMSVGPQQWAAIGHLASQRTAARRVVADRVGTWHLSSHGYFH